MNRRLNAISELITEEKIYDVGSDHGYLVKYLFDKEKIKSAYVIEINEKPLLSAKSNLNDYENIDFLLSDGLNEVSAISPNSAIVIAGMGGKLIANIVSNDIDKIKGSVLYLQPNNNEKYLREKLDELGYKIELELLVTERNKDYFILKSVNGEMNINESEINFGKNVILNYDYKQYLIKQLNKYNKINNKLLLNNVKDNKYNSLISLLEQKIGELNED